jgi:hypothetical protein
MTLAAALTSGIVIVSGDVYVCATCGRYLCWYLGKYHFQEDCHCNDEKLISLIQ